MEPIDYPDRNPGHGALLSNDTKEDVEQKLSSMISTTPYASGANNHMGSRATQNEQLMSWTLSYLQQRGFYFVDSLTTNRSAAYSTAKKLEVSAARRHIFLDNCLEESAILSQLRRLKTIALKNGCAVGIGHPFPETARAVERFLDTLKGSPFSLVHISQVLS